MPREDHPHTPFDEQAALEELDRLRQSIEGYRRQRREVLEEFDRFTQSFRTEAAAPPPVQPARIEPVLPGPGGAEPTFEEPARVEIAPVQALLRDSSPPDPVLPARLEPAPQSPAAPLAPVFSKATLPEPAPPEHAPAFSDAGRGTAGTGEAASLPGRTSNDSPKVPESSEFDPTVASVEPAHAIAPSSPMGSGVEAVDVVPPHGDLPQGLEPVTPAAAEHGVEAFRSEKQPGRLRPAMVLGLLAILLALAVVFSRPWGQPPSEQPVSAPVAATPPAPAPSPAPTPVPASPAPAPPAAAAAPAAATADGIQAQLTTLRPVWVRVLVDGERTVERELAADVRIPIRAKRTIAIRTGDAGAVQMVVDGQPQGPLGRDGEVVTKTFTARTPAPR